MDAIEVIRSESERSAAVLAETDPAAPVPSCPGWSAADLLWHNAVVHTFWAEILGQDARDNAAAGAIEEAAPARPESFAQIQAARAAATHALVAQLAVLDDDEPRWSWFEADQTVGFTRRMQVAEATIHRIDAELTAGVPVTPLDDERAAAVIDHVVDVMWGGWVPEWASTEPLAVVRLLATDTGQEWFVEAGHWTGAHPKSGRSFDEPRAQRAAVASDDLVFGATISGTANDLARWTWNRGGDVTIEGEDAAIAAITRVHDQGIN